MVRSILGLVAVSGCGFSSPVSHGDAGGPATDGSDSGDGRVDGGTGGGSSEPMLVGTPTQSADCDSACTTGARTFSYTLVDGDARLLVVAVGQSDDPNTSQAVSYAGVAMTPLAAAATSRTKVELFYLAEAELALIPAGPHAITITLASGQLVLLGIAMQFAGVDQVDPIGPAVSDTGDTAASTLDVPSAQNDVVVAALSQGRDGSITMSVPAPQVERGNIVHTSSTGGGLVASTRSGKPASTMMTGTLSAATNWAHVGASIHGP